MRKLLAVAVVLAALSLLRPSILSTNAGFTSNLADAQNGFAGATFAPTVAPVITPKVKGNSVNLSWSTVSISSGQLVTYVVTRIPSVGSPVQVCTGAEDAPTELHSIATCTDRGIAKGISYTYTEQPVVMNGATQTWSLPASTPSISVSR